MSALLALALCLTALPKSTLADVYKGDLKGPAVDAEFSLELPAGWKRVNSPGSVGFVSPDRMESVQVTGQPRLPRRGLMNRQREMAKGHGLALAPESMTKALVPSELLDRADVFLIPKAPSRAVVTVLQETSEATYTLSFALKQSPEAQTRVRQLVQSFRLQKERATEAARRAGSAGGRTAFAIFLFVLLLIGVSISAWKVGRGMAANGGAQEHRSKLRVVSRIGSRLALLALLIRALYLLGKPQGPEDQVLGWVYVVGGVSVLLGSFLVALIARKSATMSADTRSSAR